MPAWAGAQSDEAAADGVLGAQWKQLARRAGMIFAGTVLDVGPATATPQAGQPDRSFPAMDLTFRVDRPIAGVEPGQVLTVHEWTGAWSLQRPMRRGEHLLIFLYPPSRLGLTSPVGGWRGQIELDAGGQNVLGPGLIAPPGLQSGPAAALLPARNLASVTVSVMQLERAIRAARGE
jgi:hypothetical protein